MTLEPSKQPEIPKYEAIHDDAVAHDTLILPVIVVVLLAAR